MQTARSVKPFSRAGKSACATCGALLATGLLAGIYASGILFPIELVWGLLLLPLVVYVGLGMLWPHHPVQASLWTHSSCSGLLILWVCIMGLMSGTSLADFVEASWFVLAPSLVGLIFVWPWLFFATCCGACLRIGIGRGDP